MKYKKHKPVSIFRKPDTSRNPDNAVDKLAEFRRMEHGKIPVRINNKTIILVSPEKYNRLYG